MSEDVELPQSMLAARVERFGGPEVVEAQHIPVPKPRSGDVLIKVAAAGVGPWDALVRSGRSGLPQALPLTLGADLSGTVVDAGDSGFAKGTPVFGVTNTQFVGAQAEYAIAEAGRIVEKPVDLSFIAAAAFPVVAVTASTMLFELGRLELGQRVLIHGAAGSVGSLAVQLARRAGAEVVATCFSADVETVRALGADEIIDVTARPFVGAAKYADLVIDTVGGTTQRASFDVLIPGGRIVSSVSEPDQALADRAHVKASFFIVDVTRERLEVVVPTLPGLRLAVGELLPLAQVRRAHEMLAGSPHRPGKIVLTAGVN